MIKNLLLVFVTLVICIFVGEIALRLFTPFPVHYGKRKVFDERLLHVVDAGLEDIDDRGFRNPDIPETVDIAAIGDSHTYGNNVFWDESWPYQLARMSGRSVYNFGVGGYGVYQYYELFRQALEYRPKYVLIGLYIANDLAPSCKLRNLSYWRAISEELGLMSRSCIDAGQDKVKQGLRTYNSTVKAIKQASAIHSAVKYFTSEYQLEWERYVPSYTMSNGYISLSVKEGRVGTHIRATDLSRREIAEVFFNSKILFQRMVEMANENNVTLGILLLPSKQRVYYRWARREQAEMPKEIISAVQNEQALIKHYRTFFEERHVKVVDAAESVLAALDRSLVGGKPVYKNYNGHPLSVGYEAYARAAIEFLR